MPVRWMSALGHKRTYIDAFMVLGFAVIGALLLMPFGAIFEGRRDTMNSHTALAFGAMALLSLTSSTVTMAEDAPPTYLADPTVCRLLRH
jgi:hypothetical protein